MNPRIIPKNLTRKITSQGSAFWKAFIKTGDLPTDIKWEHLNELERLNRLAINIYNLSFFLPDIIHCILLENPLRKIMRKSPLY